MSFDYVNKHLESWILWQKQEKFQQESNKFNNYINVSLTSIIELYIFDVFTVFFNTEDLQKNENKYM